MTHPTGAFPAEVEQCNALPSCFSSHTANKCPFHGLFSALFVHAFVLFVGVLLFKMHSAEGMSRVPRHTKVVRCLTENTSQV